LHSVLLPCGPSLHCGVFEVPQCKHVFPSFFAHGAGPLYFLFFFEIFLGRCTDGGGILLCRCADRGGILLGRYMGGGAALGSQIGLSGGELAAGLCSGEAATGLAA
jgi:hypothetical protein